MAATFIELDRTFQVSPATKAKSDDDELINPFSRSERMTWSDLLAKPRVVILSGGGSGKTFEIRERARRLHASGQPSFFIRIEHIRQDFEGAFDHEAGSYDQFKAWLTTGKEGWIFLDSVDEARLKSPKEFEQAINRLGRELKPVLPQAHIIVTGREAAWRARTDRELIQSHLPFEAAAPLIQSPVDSDASIPLDDEDPESDDDDRAEIESRHEAEERDGSTPIPERNAVLVVAFDGLNEEQIRIFAAAKNVTDIPAFVSAIRRREAQSEAERPSDLEGLIDFWQENRRIGTQFELTDASITRRLSEKDPNRKSTSLLTPQELREGARALAAANLLMQTPEIRLPEASSGTQGVVPEDLLNWVEEKVEELLQRPLFVASQFGSVRVYVQKVRDFLTAEWLHALLVDHASRVRIERLFFQEQYGEEVVVPTMRGVLPWLALLDGSILARVRRVAPEVMFEGGDPSRLPLEMRRSLLSQACALLAQNPMRASAADNLAVQRFAAPDLADHIKALLGKYRSDGEVTYFLVRMIWQGEIKEAKDSALALACTSTNLNVRQIAIRSLEVFGEEADRESIRASLVAKGVKPERAWVAESMGTLPEDSKGVAWMLAACRAAKPEEQYTYDRMPDAIEAYVSRIPMKLLHEALVGFHALLGLPEEEDDSGRRRLPRAWLLRSAMIALNRLVQAQHPTTLDAVPISLLLRIPGAVPYGDADVRKEHEDLQKSVGTWAELNHALMWADVAATRARHLRKKPSEAVNQIWCLGVFGHYWRLHLEDFDFIEQEIEDRSLMDDRLVALSVAIVLQRQKRRSMVWLKRLKERVKGVDELEKALEVHLAPVPEHIKKSRRQTARWQQRSRRDAARREANRKEWQKYLREHIDSLKVPLAGGVGRHQSYLQDRMREFDKSSSRWTEGRWRSLIPEFGHEVALAFREGAISFWRSYVPTLQSEGAERNTTTHGTVFGLTGLLIESREVTDWATELSPEEARLAARYAMLELNGFPPWLPVLFKAHPDEVAAVVLGEIRFELKSAKSADSPSHYVLGDVSGVGRWMWTRLAPDVLSLLNPAPFSVAHLRDVLTILAGAEQHDAEIATLARAQVNSGSNAVAAIWLATWIGVEPDAGIAYLKTHLDGLSDDARQEEFAMHCLTALTGGRHGYPLARDKYRTVPHLTELFLLMHQYIVEANDVNRAGTGVYSPTLRDEAQDARDALLAQLQKTPGADAYFALKRIAIEHPSDRGRDWGARLAHDRAVADSVRPGWSSSQVREFRQRLERTPRNELELYDLAIDRLADYKHFLEDGEMSTAATLLSHEETVVRNAATSWLHDQAGGRYLVAQEEERADKKRTDIRFRSMSFDNPVPIELKLANKWRGPELVERLENQLCNDYLRGHRSSCGVFLLIHQGGDQGYSRWNLPDGSKATSVEVLVEGLRKHWAKVSGDFPHVTSVHIIGIDLTKRDQEKGRPVTKGGAKRAQVVSTKKNSAARSTAKATKAVTRKAAAKRRPIARQVAAKKAASQRSGGLSLKASDRRNKRISPMQKSVDSARKSLSKKTDSKRSVQRTSDKVQSKRARSRKEARRH